MKQRCTTLRKIFLELLDSDITIYISLTFIEAEKYKKEFPRLSFTKYQEDSSCNTIYAIKNSIF